MKHSKHSKGKNIPKNASRKRRSVLGNASSPALRAAAAGDASAPSPAVG